MLTLATEEANSIKSAKLRVSWLTSSLFSSLVCPLAEQVKDPPCPGKIFVTSNKNREVINKSSDREFFVKE
jgi:hypothetical protein